MNGNGPTFYATLDASSGWAGLPDVPVMLTASSFARRRRGPFELLSRPKLPPLSEVACDSGGFLAARKHTDYEYVSLQYANWLAHIRPSWAAMMDYPVEPELAPTPERVRERQVRTTERAYWLWEHFGPDAPWAWVPTVQGWEVDEYRRHAAELAPLVEAIECEYAPDRGLDIDPDELGDYDPRTIDGSRARNFRVGIGTLCRRASPRMIARVVEAVAAELPGVPVHLWGVKLGTFSQALPPSVVSVDSAAWSQRFGSDIDTCNAEQRQLGMTQRQYAYRVLLPRYLERVEAAIAGRRRQLSMFS